MAGIPGLGLMEEAPPTTSSSREFELQPFWEYCFETSFGSPGITVKLLSGTAEKDGTELNARHPYHFSSTKSKILTIEGCRLQVDGACDEEWVAKDPPPPAENVANLLLNAHHNLRAMRDSAASRGAHGPRVLLAGPPNSGKTTCVKTLASYATKMGEHPLVVNLNPDEGMLTLPGTLSAAVFASVMDIESRQGWGAPPASGPGAIPPKVPVVQFYGHQEPEEDPALYREMVAALADSVSARLADDPAVKRAGLIIDTAGVDHRSKEGLGILSHIISEFSVNVVLILDSKSLEDDLKTTLRDEGMGQEEPIHVLSISKSRYIPTRDELWLLQEREADIKEYFFGDARMVLSPSTQLVDFDSLSIYKIPESGKTYNPDLKALERVQPSPDMVHWTLAIMQATSKDSPEAIRSSLVLGFVYIAHVDVERSKMKILAPLPGRLGDRPLILGKWPEPHVNLLG